jgi:type II secretory pathway pseudopilin PulG
MKGEKGFSLIEIMIAILIVTTGLLALSAALIIGVTLPGRARQQEIAKQLANTIMESIIAAKESSRPGFNSFDSLNFTSSNPPGRFLPGVAAMLEAGPDGVYGTCDDGQPPGTFNPNCPGLGSRVMQLDVDPGSDGIYSRDDRGNDRSADNRKRRLFAFTREIRINNISANTKEIEVRVNYSTPTGSRDTVRLVCQLTNFRTL